MRIATSLSFTKKKHETDDIYTFYFTPKKPLKQKAGQHGLFILPGLYRPHPFTLSSAPGEDYVAFSTHVETGSRYKNRLMNLKRGDKVSLVGPILNFTFQPNETDYVFLAQGVGITPFRSMLVHADAEKLDINTTLIHVDKSEHSFKSLTRKLATKAYFPDSSQAFKFHLNDVNNESLFYVSGSPKFNKETRKYLIEMGVPARRIKSDSFLGY